MQAALKRRRARARSALPVVLGADGLVSREPPHLASRSLIRGPHAIGSHALGARRVRPREVWLREQSCAFGCEALVNLTAYLVLGAAGLLTRLWLERAFRSPPRASARPTGRRPSRVDVSSPRAELATVARALDLVVHPTRQRAEGGAIRIDYRVDGRVASFVRVRGMDRSLPPFALVAEREGSAELPVHVAARIAKLLEERRSFGARAPFVAWEPPPHAAWDGFRHVASRVANDVQLLEHEDGVLTAWAVAWFPEHTIAQVRSVAELARLKPPRVGPFR